MGEVDVSSSISASSASSLVSWSDVLDPANPKNFSCGMKCLIGLVIGLMNLIVSFAISVFSGVEDQVKEAFHGKDGNVMQRGVSLYIFGLAMGPLFFGPASEFYGRKRPLLAGMLGFMFSTILVTVVRDFDEVVVFRFIAGAYGSAAYVIPPGIYVDLYGPVGRAIGYMIFASGAFIGGSLGPAIATVLVESHGLDWRWSMWITVLFACPLTMILIFLPETLEAILLQRLSQKMRQQTGDWSWHCARDEAPFELKDFLLKPWRMMVQEPVLIVVTLAFTLDYGIQSLTYTAIPQAFSKPRGWTESGSAWALTVTIVGFVVGCVVVVLDTQFRFAKRLRGGGLVLPESRLPPMIAGMAILSFGLLLFSWTAVDRLPVIEQLLAEIPIGAGMYMVWVTGTVYLQDLYVIHANSALAACAFVRYSVGSVFPLFAASMYNKLGMPWSIRLLGILCAVLVPLHVIFYVFGKKVRSWSRFALHDCYHISQ
ncbi:hypothetical protein M409DRAFT_67499 [Zasmidium cellare ATCC 36951]|uniref:Major facilitator superfamily (MFS) profile domain-containing protein n=1 Tax=Zasmidium cellare ATCC 36951 TaxID=1080233 RepID=A0A6A6CDG9_ZASCE|nr:uncharacterized protein M409DRAFT_67499 [Zasmidium cellare ATCC 36951]KAF2165257.1 hypothetical protein M409DRAFT_67499 [Zasmidium cellare ATCC 36951]